MTSVSVLEVQVFVYRAPIPLWHLLAWELSTIFSPWNPFSFGLVLFSLVTRHLNGACRHLPGLCSGINLVLRPQNGGEFSGICGILGFYQEFSRYQLGSGPGSRATWASTMSHYVPDSHHRGTRALPHHWGLTIRGN